MMPTKCLCHVVLAVFPLFLSAQEINFDDLQRVGSELSQTTTISGLAKEGAKYHDQFLAGDRAAAAKLASQNTQTETSQARPMTAVEQAKCLDNRSQCHANCDYVASSNSGSGFFGGLVAMGLNSGCKAICNKMECTSGSVGSFIGKMIDGERGSSGTSQVGSPAKKPDPANAIKRFSCTVYCASGNTTQYKGTAENRKKMAVWMGDHADDICREKRNEAAKRIDFSERQCSEY